MSITFDKSVTERIREETDIVDVVSSYMTIQKTGNNYWGLCPFHSEKTPSFSVSEDRQTYHCFGCGEGGDVFSFVMHKENCDFPEAVRILGKRAGINVEIKSKETLAEDLKRERMYELNRMAANFYLTSLARSPGAIEYLKKRGLSLEICRRFGLGYALNDWNQLLKFMKNQSVSEQELVDAGLVKSSENGRYYDTFRNRIMFPLIDIKKRVLGFGGRSVSDEKPKYLNSSENEIFHKRNYLYGLNLVKQHSDKSYIILVEGYMDVIAFFNKDIPRAVASMGTSLTEEQVHQLSKYGRDIYICYDTDDAGRKATERAIDIFIGYGYSPKVISLPDGKDPDDYFKKHSRDDFEELLNSSDTHYEFRKKYLYRFFDVNQPDQKTRIIQEMNAYISKIKDPIEREVYVEKLAEDMKISSGVLTANRSGVDYRSVRKNPFQISTRDVRHDIEYEMIKFSLLDIEYFRAIQSILPEYEFENKNLGEIYETVELLYKEYGELDRMSLYNDLLEKNSKHFKQLKELIFDDASFFVSDEKNMFENFTNKVNAVFLEQRRDVLLKKIQEFQETKNNDASNEDEISELCNQLMSLNREISLSQDN